MGSQSVEEVDTKVSTWQKISVILSSDNVIIKRVI